MKATPNATVANTINYSDENDKEVVDKYFGPLYTIENYNNRSNKNKKLGKHPRALTGDPAGLKKHFLFRPEAERPTFMQQPEYT